MNRYYDLLKNNFLDFNRILLEKYCQLKLNELDVVILMKLNSYLIQGEKAVSFDRLISTMAATEEECSSHVIDLVNKGIITMELLPETGKETYGLDELYRKLSFIIDGEDDKQDKKELKQSIKTTVNDLEREFKKILTPLEIQTVNKWYVDYHYQYEEICDALLETLRIKTRGINFMDRYLYKQHNETPAAAEVNSNIKDMFSKVYNGRQ
ncbi:MAG TPA: DnaD domain protein [Bacilli bacterium]|nr:DnaD domain protein [Bacilli bacterium]